MQTDTNTAHRPAQGAAAGNGVQTVQAAKHIPSPDQVTLPIVLSDRALSRLMADILKA